MLAEEGERWDVYRVARGEYPPDEHVSLYHGFVITGSCHDAHGNDAWVRDLLAFLHKLDSMRIKVLGICFGHQILGRALGGKVTRSPTGWDIGVRTVTELPPKAEVIAGSDKTGIEMFRYGDHIMGIQGHPEYTKDILLHLIDRLVQRNFIMEGFAAEARAKAALWEPDREAWKRVCISFLKGRL
ncbi:gamma-glutamyl peptidase 5-like [Senna tora]|uniref:Gamma-glutamyl peptidase 5-like n=1 Tax=Senna tora TaxID=362788 RepID=A0A835CJ01_9FABA|nr:gamma-glutamyl peptidase 5-like [Senna tora]